MAQRLAQIAVSAARSCSALAAPPQEAGLLAATLRLLGSAELQCGARLLHISPLQRQGNEQAAEDVQRKALINRMLYRSRQRGFLELDLLMGMWAEREVQHMSTDVIREFEIVLDQENPDMFKWLTTQEEAPPEMQANRAFRLLQQHVKGLTDQHHSVPPPPAGEAPKEWVRGWTDSGKELSGGGTSSSGSS